jgi:exopolyphosphatase/guanosine-5'-triphosphate,3'-diphosphate pyrophosphatase
MKVAALDLGTNSFLCLISEVKNGEIQQIYSDQVQIVRLGQDVNRTRRFQPEALQRARHCLEMFQKTIQQHRPEKVLAMATSAARDVSNAEELFQIGRDLNIPIEIIPGEKEAEITFKGSISGLPKDQKVRAVIDIGGGSTEIIAGTDQKILGGRSINVGAVRLTEMFFPHQPPKPEEIHKFQDHLQKEMAPLIKELASYKIQELIAVAGTPTELVAATIGKFDPVQIDGYVLSEKRLQDWVNKFKKSSTLERTENMGISKGRADVILAGTMIMHHVLKAMNFTSLKVSTRGVRFGVALELEKRNAT